MVKYFRKKFALSEKGARDLSKAIIACTLTNIALLIPVGIFYMLLTELVSPLIGGKESELNLWLYVGLSVLMIAMLFILHFIQYNATYLASYSESANKRITLAEKLRKIPLSFFGKPADLMNQSGLYKHMVELQNQSSKWKL